MYDAVWISLANFNCKVNTMYCISAYGQECEAPEGQHMYFSLWKVKHFTSQLKAGDNLYLVESHKESHMFVFCKSVFRSFKMLFIYFKSYIIAL